MCQQFETTTQSVDDNDHVTTTNENEPFPWHIPLYDAHCHPTDIMSSISSLQEMRTRALTIMATRSQDQGLVSSVAKVHGITDPFSDRQGDSCKVVPAFGWHPWFSHQLFDDTASKVPFNLNLNKGFDAFEAKKAHYQEVLQPKPDDQVSDSHAFIDSLPTPKSMSDFLNDTEQHLKDHSLAMIGEIGLDKAFRLPGQRSSQNAPQRDGDLTPGGREGRMLSPYRVKMEHQQMVLLKQLNLAGKMGRAVSVHGVQAHGVLHSTLKESWKGHERKVLSKRQRKREASKADAEGFSSDSEPSCSKSIPADPANPAPSEPKPYPPRVCLHSFSGAPEVLHQYLEPSIPTDIYFSFSSAVNLSTKAGRAKLIEVLKVVPKDRLLVESDLHKAGREMDEGMENIVRFICEEMGWGLEEGVLVLGENWRRFVFGERGGS